MANLSERAKQLALQIKKNPNDSFSKFALALEFRKAGMMDKCIQLFENIRKNDPNYIGTYYHLAKAYEFTKDYQKALSIYEEGIAKAKVLSEAHALSELHAAKTELEWEIED